MDRAMEQAFVLISDHGLCGAAAIIEDASTPRREMTGALSTAGSASPIASIGSPLGRRCIDAYLVYDRWYLDEQRRRQSTAHNKRATAAPPVRILDRREACPRRALEAAQAADGASCAALSRMIGRPDHYLSRFVRDGHPKALTADEHRYLALFFGVDERGLGERQLWVPMR